MVFGKELRIRMIGGGDRMAKYSLPVLLAAYGILADTLT